MNAKKRRFRTLRDFFPKRHQDGLVKPLIFRRHEKGLSFSEYKALQKVSLAADVQLVDGSLSLDEFRRMARETAYIPRVRYTHLGESTIPEHLIDAETRPHTAGRR